MKHLKLLSTSILIASALLLSGANQSPQPRPSPRPAESARPQIQQQNNDGKREQAAPFPTPTQINHVQSTPHETPTPDSNTQIQRQLVAIEGKIANFTLLLVLVGALQVVAAVFQVRASGKAAASATSSAEAARAALLANRPYLLPNKATLSMNGILTDQRIVWATNVWLEGVGVEFVNSGNGPAIVDRVVGQMRLQEFADDYPPSQDFTRCKELRHSNDVVVSDGKVTFHSNEGDDGMGFAVRRQQFERFYTGKDVLFYGCVYYSDALRNEYRTEFCLTLHPVSPEHPDKLPRLNEKGAVDIRNSWIWIGPRENNRRT